MVLARGSRLTNSIRSLHETQRKCCHKRLKASPDVSDCRLNKHRLINSLERYIDETALCHENTQLGLPFAFSPKVPESETQPCMPPARARGGQRRDSVNVEGLWFAVKGTRCRRRLSYSLRSAWWSLVAGGVATTGGTAGRTKIGAAPSQSIPGRGAGCQDRTDVKDHDGCQGQQGHEQCGTRGLRHGVSLRETGE